MIRMLTALTLAAAALAAPLTMPALADDRNPPPGPRHQLTPEQKAAHEARRKEWEAMTPEQRQAKMEEHRKQREARMTPEQRAAHEARRKEWEAMTPEQRQAKMEEHRKHREARKGQKHQPQQ